MKSAICRGWAIWQMLKSTTDWQRKVKCVAKFRKWPCFWVKMNIKIPTLADMILSNKGRYYGVGDGTRTHNARNHNPVLCQLNYTHHMKLSWVARQRDSPNKVGTPEGTRTPDLLLRRQLLYPAELLAHNLERVTRIELASPAWKAGALTIVLHPHSSPTENSSPQLSSASS